VWEICILLSILAVVGGIFQFLLLGGIRKYAGVLGECGMCNIQYSEILIRHFLGKSRRCMYFTF
jgi:hypothetical protein